RFGVFLLLLILLLLVLFLLVLFFLFFVGVFLLFLLLLILLIFILILLLLIFLLLILILLLLLVLLFLLQQLSQGFELFAVGLYLQAFFYSGQSLIQVLVDILGRCRVKFVFGTRQDLSLEVSGHKEKWKQKEKMSDVHRLHILRT